jgi:hypothetical protein
MKRTYSTLIPGQWARHHGKSLVKIKSHVDALRAFHFVLARAHEITMRGYKAEVCIIRSRCGCPIFTIHAMMPPIVHAMQLSL